MSGIQVSAFSYFEDSIGIRQSTMYEVLAGELSLIERRAKIINQRRSLLFDRPDLSSAGDIEIEADIPEQEDSDDEQEANEDNKPAIIPLEVVDVIAESPTEYEIQAANTVAQKYPDAESVVLSDDIRVNTSSGGRFDLRIAEVLEREFGLVDNTDTTEPSTPSMSEAAEFV
jgi:hypothetical protein